MFLKECVRASSFCQLFKECVELQGLQRAMQCDSTWLTCTQPWAIRHSPGKLSGSVETLNPGSPQRERG